MIKVLDKAIQMEKNASAFYSAAASKVNSREGKKMFDWLSKFEQSHLMKLEKEKKVLLRHDSMAGYKVENKSGDTGLSEADESSVIKPETSDEEILKRAIYSERKAYSFYQRKMTATENPSVRKLLGEFSKEEDKHIRILNEQLKSIRTDRLWKEFTELKDL